MTRGFITFIEKYNKMSLPIKAGFWFTICNFLQRGITMLTTPIFTRVLSEEQYGIISTFSSWQSVLLLVTSLSLYKAMMNLYVKYDNKEKVLSALCSLGLIMTISWLLLYLLFSTRISNLLGMSKTLTICLFLSFIPEAGILCWMTYKRYIFDYKSVIFVTLLMTAFSSIVGIICVVFISSSAQARLIPQTIISLIIGIYIYSIVFKRNKTFYNKDMWTFSISFCVGLMPHYLSEFVLQSSDKLMINYMCGSADVAIYSIAYSVGSLINLVTNAINSVFAPYQYQQIQAGNYRQLAKRANAVLMLVAFMLGGIMLFSREIVLIFGGDKYVESIKVIIPICVGIFFNYLFQLFARVQEFYNRKVTVVIPSIMCAVLNLILNFIYIRIYGYQAAAYTTLVCYMLFCVIHYYFYRKVCKEEIKGNSIYNIKGIFSISSLLLIGSIIVFFVNQVLWLKYTIMIVLGIILLIKHKSIIFMIKNLLKSD